MTRRFPRSARVRTRAEYDRIFQHGRRVALPVLALHWRPASGPASPATGSVPAGAGPDTPDGGTGADQARPASGAAGADGPSRRDAAAALRSRGPESAAPPRSPGPAPEPTEPRLGLAVSRKVDRRAVGRNRIKRALRESFREHRAQLAPGEYVLVARSGATALDSAALQRTLLSLLRRAGALPPVSPAGTMPPAACTDRVQPPSR